MKRPAHGAHCATGARFGRRSWDRRVGQVEQLARSPGLLDMRDRIVALAAPTPEDVVVDLGAGTGLLTLACAADALAVWAVDSSQPMCDRLVSKAQSAGLSNVRAVRASITRMPLPDGVASIVVSNYCFHELDEREKLAALAEAHRVLRPGGRLVVGDMMFGLDPRRARNRQIVAAKLRSMARRGLPGLLRIARNALRLATARWENPRSAEWWRATLARSEFEAVTVEVLGHEGGIAFARRRVRAAREVRGGGSPRDDASHSPKRPRDVAPAGAVAHGD